MAGYDPAKAARMNQLAQQFPNATLSTLATLARVSVSDLGNYTNDSVGTRASNANFGRVTSEESQNVQSSNTAPRINPVTGRAFVAPTPTPVDETAAFEQEFDGAGQTPPVPTPRPAVLNSTQNNTNSFGSAGSQDAFRDTPLPPAQTQDTDVDFTDAYGENFRQATPIPTPVVQPRDTDVDFTDAYGESFREVTPIPPSTRRPGVEQATLPPGSRGSGEFLDDRGRAPAEQPDPFPEPPPGRPAQPISQVDDFSGTGITQVDDFGGPSRNVTPVDDFSAYTNNNFGQVDDFAEINTPAQVDDFSAYTNNNFGTEDPGLDAFGPGPTPAPPANIQEYNQTQFDPFGDVVQESAPAQVDDFADYSDNNFGAQVDDFEEINSPAQVDDFADYSDNNFGAQVDDFAEYESPSDVNQFGVDDFGDNNPLGQVDDFAEFESPSDVNAFGVDDFGDPEAAQFDEFGDPLRAPADVNPFGVDDFGDPEAAQFDEFGDPILAPEDRVDADGESLVGDDPTGEFDDLDGVDGVEQAAISQQQEAALQAQALKAKAQQQQTVSEMREASGVKNADGDWRVNLRLAPQATYLYQAPDPGILAPLTETDGIIFPYTPSIDIQYRAEYNAYSPTHSNYQHFFYQGSSVATVQLNADFTAQDTVEAEYLLAVIHFLKSASKMFYGQDAQRGSPPPLLYLTGLGEYQFNESPCVISEFNYNLPPDVNYIRARSKQIQRDGQLQYQKPLATSVTNGNFSSLTRLATAATNAINGKSDPIRAGAETTKLVPGKLGTKGATYVPTKATISLVLNPIVSRQQVSQQFSLKEYANGNLIKKGMW